jgi:small subunit ribosomal protein S21
VKPYFFKAYFLNTLYNLDFRASLDRNWGNSSLDFPHQQGDNYYCLHLGRVWGCYRLAEVRIQEGESLENALRRFKRKVQQEDIIKEVKRHSFYLKPGEKKRVKEALARKRSRKKARKEQD